MEQKTNSSLYKYELNPTQLANALTTFLAETKADDINNLLGNKPGKFISSNPKDKKIIINTEIANKFSNSDLAVIRRINPQGFDAALAAAAKLEAPGQETSPPKLSSEQLISSILKEGSQKQESVQVATNGNSNAALSKAVPLAEQATSAVQAPGQKTSLAKLSEEGLVDLELSAQKVKAYQAEEAQAAKNSPKPRTSEEIRQEYSRLRKAQREL